MDLKSFIQYWNEYLNDWMHDAKQKMTDELKCGHYFCNSKVLQSNIDYLPEPYYGNPFDSSAVIIDLNPGLSSSFDYRKKRPVGDLFLEVQKLSYSDFNEKYSPFLDSSLATIGTPFEIPGAKWWRDNRMKWIGSFLKDYMKCTGTLEPHHSNSPFVMELCPWHSKKWTDSIIRGMESHLYNTVFEPACLAIKSSSFNKFGFCFGKVAGDALLKNSFVVARLWNKEHPVGEWPLNKEKEPTNRTYRLLKREINGEVFYFLNLYADGTFHTPSEEFRKKVEPALIKELVKIVEL